MEFATVVRNMSRILCDLSGISPSPLRWLDASWGNWLTAWVARGFFHPRQLLHSDSGSLPQLHSESSSNLSESSNDIRSPSSHSNILWSQLQLVCSAWPVEIFKHPFLYPILRFSSSRKLQESQRRGSTEHPLPPSPLGWRILRCWQS